MSTHRDGLTKIKIALPEIRPASGENMSPATQDGYVSENFYMWKYIRREKRVKCLCVNAGSGSRRMLQVGSSDAARSEVCMIEFGPLNSLSVEFT